MMGLHPNPDRVLSLRIIPNVRSGILRLTGMEDYEVDIPEDMKASLAEKLRDSREDLARFPTWLSTGSQKEFDEWFLGDRRVKEIRQRIQNEVAKRQSLDNGAY
jgi:hypothetical protein